MTLAAGPRTAEIARWKRRARLVAFFRKALPAAILAILLFLAGWIIARTVLPSLRPQVELGAIRMTNPRFYGRDSRDRPFLLGAKEAVRDISDKGQITLIEPIFSLGAGRVTAKKGLYRDGATNLILTGDVLFIDENGGRMETQEALINTKTGTISNAAAKTAGVQIDGSFGKVRAESYTVGKDGTVTFKGNVHARIIPR
jgi:lipopolysaccharide export system protein LptC